jgi:TldD protein
VASELVTMADLAHHWNGQELMVPVYADDEGTPAEDVVMIDRGRLAGFMHSRETAARMGQAPTGNARAYGPHDEPLVRMRNTVILPGDSTLEQMIEGVDDGYLLLAHVQRPGRYDHRVHVRRLAGLRDPRRHARSGHTRHHAVGQRDGGAASVDAVGSEMHWDCAGYCGKKQPMIVSVGGPALRARAHLGGE